MKQLLTLLLTLYTATMCLAQVRSIEVPLWPSGAPNTNGLSGAETIPYDKHIANVSQPTLTVHLPEKPNGMAVVMCPGGGYGLLSMHYEGHDGAQWFCSRGITYAVLKYRMPAGNCHVPLSDAARAIRLLRERAQEWNLCPSQVGIMGASAGGHLAAITATTADSLSRPDFQILLYPVITMLQGTHIGSRNSLLGSNPTPEQCKEYSAECRVTSSTPPAFITLSADDKAVPASNSLNYCSALIRQGIPASLHLYPSGGHGWGFRPNFPHHSLWLSELSAWLDEISKVGAK